MAISIERLRQLLPVFKSEKKPVVPTLSSYIDAIIGDIFNGKPYRVVLYEIRNDPNLSPQEKTARIRDLQKHYDPSWEWKSKNGEIVLRDKRQVLQA